MNYMKQVAEMIGVEIGEEFKVFLNDGTLDSRNPFKITNRGLIDDNGYAHKHELALILAGECTIKKLQWKPKDGDTIYFIDITDDEGYGWRIDSTDSEIEMLTSRGLKLHRTEEEVQQAVKELGWEVK